MKIVFAGTPEVAAIVLKRLLEEKTRHKLVSVLTQPDRPSGRGHKMLPSPVKALALEHGLPVHQPLRLREPLIQDILRAEAPDLIIVVAYGLMIPQAVLDLPRFGCWNLHFSLLPRWRGASPIQRAIEAGDTETGVSLMQMDAGLDTGPILLQTRLPLSSEVSSGELHVLLAEAGASLLIKGLALQAESRLFPQAQAETGLTYAAKLSKEEACITWSDSAALIARKVRAFHPWPMAYTLWGKEIIRIGAARALSRAEFDGLQVDDLHSSRDKNLNSLSSFNNFHPSALPGELALLTPHRVGIMTGEGVLELLSVQRPGGKMMPIAVFLNGQPDFFKHS